MRRPPPISTTSSRSRPAPTPHGSTSTARTRACRCSTTSPSATSTVSDHDAWIYDSRQAAATHVTVDRAALDALKAEVHAEAEAHADEARDQLEAELGTPLPTPEEVLDQALAKLDETTEVSVGTDARVAGREVYELVLEPRDADTLVGEISVAIDGENGRRRSRRR